MEAIILYFLVEQVFLQKAEYLILEAWMDYIIRNMHIHRKLF